MLKVTIAEAQPATMRLDDVPFGSLCIVTKVTRTFTDFKVGDLVLALWHDDNEKWKAFRFANPGTTYSLNVTSGINVRVLPKGTKITIEV